MGRGQRPGGGSGSLVRGGVRRCRFCRGRLGACGMTWSMVLLKVRFRYRRTCKLLYYLEDGILDAESRPDLVPVSPHVMSP